MCILHGQVPCGILCGSKGDVLKLLLGSGIGSNLDFSCVFLYLYVDFELVMFGDIIDVWNYGASFTVGGLYGDVLILYLTGLTYIPNKLQNNNRCNNQTS